MVPAWDTNAVALHEHMAAQQGDPSARVRTVDRADGGECEARREGATPGSGATLHRLRGESESEGAMRYIGIDPGTTGACARIWDNGAIEIVDIPTFVIEGKKKRTVLDGNAMFNVLKVLAVSGGEPHLMRIFLEAPSLGAAMRGRGKKVQPADNSFGADAEGGQSINSLASTFLMNGQIQGILISLAAVYGVSYEIPNPQVWKRQMMPGEARDKDAARQKAIQLFPSVAEDLKRKKDHNRAEALLLAEWGRRRG